MNLFPPHLCDFYKVGHAPMYPYRTEFIYSYLMPRSDARALALPDFDHKVVAAGFQGVIQWLFIDLWNNNFFKRPLAEVLARYQNRMDGSLGAGKVSTDNIESLHRLGYLPLHIKALPEGSRVGMKVPLLTIVNTHPAFGWLTNYMETMLSAECWKTITAATTAYEYRRLLDRYAALTGAPTAFVPWQGHDFSMRGMSGIHDAAQTGLGHLLSFTGTDTIPAIDYACEYYQGNGTFVGGSVPASEHSVMCADGKAGEEETFRRLMRAFPVGVLSVVSDTWDFWKVVTTVAANLKPEILARQPDASGQAKLVFRPDSGDPVKIICGDPEAEAGTPAFKGAVQCLWEVFGGTTNAAGFKVLDSHVGLIYGDSITLDRAQRILQGLHAAGYASSNIVFGIGSFTYQYATRDNFGQAVKASYAVVDGVGRELAKDPITDHGKKSVKGLLRVERNQKGDFILFDQQTLEEEKRGELRTIFRDGVASNVESIARIRDRLHPEGFAG